MKTVWDKGATLDEEVAAFTVGDDRTIDTNFARQDVIGSLAHVAVIEAGGLLDGGEALALRRELRTLYHDAEAGRLRPGPEDEDIHGTLERMLTAKLGAPGKRVHTGRSRNDQVATNVALWLREQALLAHGETLRAAVAARAFAKEHEQLPLPGLTHLQPAMPSTFGQWAAGYASLLLDDAAALRAAFAATAACPLGSAAGYGVPEDLARIDRGLSARLLGFDRPAEPATAVQGGRGKQESGLLFALCQACSTCARLAWDVVLFVNPDLGYLRLPDSLVTGSSIMPQKRNPDVMELVRGSVHSVRASLNEVLGLLASVPSGYHRDFQLLKAPLVRGTATARGVLRIVGHVLPLMEVVPERAKEACGDELFATHRALELVGAGEPFREAYRQVAEEVSTGTLPAGTSRSLPGVGPALAQTAERIEEAESWQRDGMVAIEQVYGELLGPRDEE